MLSLTLMILLLGALPLSAQTPSGAEPFTFITLTDPRPRNYTGGTQALTEDLNQIPNILPAGWPHPAFVFYVGDIDEPRMTEDAYIAARNDVATLCHVFLLGNHEVDLAGTPYLTQVKNHYPKMLQFLPIGARVALSSPAPTHDTMFMLEYQNAAFLCLDIYYDGAGWTAAGGLYDRVLNFTDQAFRTTTKPVKFAFYHEPCYPDVRHVGDSLDIDPARRDRFWGMLVNFGVSTTYVGHTHQSDMEEVVQGIREIDGGSCGLMPTNYEKSAVLIATAVMPDGSVMHRRARTSNPLNFRDWTNPTFTDKAAPNPTGGNRAPTAYDQSVMTNIGAPVAIDLTALDPDFNPLTFPMAAPAYGTVSGTPPHVTYTPNPGFSGTDAFAFAAFDGLAQSNVAVVSINVSGPPIVTLLSPADQATATSNLVTFSCHVEDSDGLARATLYVGGATQTLVFSGAAQTDDAQISADAPSTNYGAAFSINVDGLSPHAHAVMKFPTLIGSGAGQIPPGATIQSAILEVNCTNLGNPVNAYRLTQDWNESQATWTQRAGGLAWANPGADGSGSNAGVAVSGVFSATGRRTIDLTRFVQEWSYGSPNYGLVLTDGGSDGIDFDSSESANPPVLRVTYRAWTAVQTQTLSGGAADVTFPNISLADGAYDWNVLAVDALNTAAWAPSNFHLTVNSTPTPQPPAAANDAYTVNQDSTLRIAAPGVLANDSDPEGAPLSAVLVNTVAHGALTLHADGSFAYQPAAGYSGADSFTYKASDGGLLSNVATVAITVKAVVVGNPDAYVIENPIVTYGTIASGGISGTTSPGDGLVQKIDEAAYKTATYRLRVEYSLHTSAARSSISGIELHVAATWTALDSSDGLKVFIGDGLAWKDITLDLSDGIFAPATGVQNYVDASGNIRLRFTDTRQSRRERKDTLTVDWLYAKVTTL
jgi:hypothetical protein